MVSSDILKKCDGMIIYSNAEMSLNELNLVCVFKLCFASIWLIGTYSFYVTIFSSQAYFFIVAEIAWNSFFLALLIARLTPLPLAHPVVWRWSPVSNTDRRQAIVWTSHMAYSWSCSGISCVLFPWYPRPSLERNTGGETWCRGWGAQYRRCRSDLHSVTGYAHSLFAPRKRS